MGAKNSKKAQAVDGVGQALSPAQEAVIAALLAGQTQAQAAQAAGVRPEQVSRWKAKDARFVAELNRRQVELWEASRLELLSLAAEARQTLRELLQSDNEGARLRAAQALLKAQMPERPNLPTTAAEVEREWKEKNMFALLSYLAGG